MIDQLEKGDGCHMHRWLGIFLIIAVTVATGGNALAISPATSAVTVQGPLEKVATLGAAHFEVDGYMIIHDNPDTLVPLLGLEVIAIGTEVTEPNIFMRKALQITTILPLPATTAPPPYYGTPFRALFGSLEMVNDQGTARFYIYTDQPTYKQGYRVESDRVDLRAFAGRRVGALALPKLQDTDFGYVVHSVIALDTDLANALHDGSATIYSSPPEPIRLTLNGQPIPFDHDPILGNGRILVGLRVIVEALGASVRWSEPTQTAIVKLGDREVRVRVGSNRVVIRKQGDPERIILHDIAPVIVGGRTMVPLRVLTEGLGLRINWNATLSQGELHR